MGIKIVFLDYQKPKAGVDNDEDEIVEVNLMSAVTFVITTSVFLLLLYFFMSSSFVWVLIILFCIGGVRGALCIVDDFIKEQGFLEHQLNLVWYTQVRGYNTEYLGNNSGMCLSLSLLRIMVVNCKSFASVVLLRFSGGCKSDFAHDFELDNSKTTPCFSIYGLSVESLPFGILRCYDSFMILGHKLVTSEYVQFQQMKLVWSNVFFFTWPQLGIRMWFRLIQFLIPLALLIVYNELLFYLLRTFSSVK
ncbi:hypothetical protein POM88_007386 [Heracleum sosnowskyi]|uniref:Uncharacterized protein n=1 Tax=Heracleum sosnowskyi TaxID=360622 RepID=A0AAD8J5B1_9APIA|nr:hypothetical protein POM88_007386 [Heracleum sosnowskyi]